MPRQSRQASSAATNASSSTAGSSPPAASPAASTPPPASGAGSSAAAAAAAAAGSPEQVPADRELQHLCPGTGCNTNLFLKENIHKDRADYCTTPAGTLAPVPARLLIKYPGKVCWLCASEFEVGEVVWAYTTPDVERPACYINWCLNEDACIILKEEGAPVNVRLAGEDDVAKRCSDCKRADSTILDTDQLIAKSTQPCHVDQPLPSPPSNDTCDVLYGGEHYRTLKFNP
ncbi:hypothetical protein Esi_0014_0037 [Ectocarpus siliculosus]|uniref:Uncharacterized protein n=1 Tax=Ectocarpus siliculosus TaxID=2880 RepID=D8LET1_ECTSI|nr:hypothetical protein Esi_0014_0037 [Ectocarpus siliculosus]|eukprot:CBN79751.1 hypothetical protein Esi_0014_0037 [Ectocarpus siliculosus]